MRTTLREKRVAGITGWAMAACCLLAVGCERSPSQDQGTPDAAGPTAATQPAAPPKPVQPEAADDRDDRGAPPALPRSNDLPGWVKTKPIRVAGPDRVATLVEPLPLASAVRSYGVRQVARCTYTRHKLDAEVTLFDMATPADAFGVFTLLTQQPGLSYDPMHRSIRVEEDKDGRWRKLGWQGSACVLVEVAGPRPAEDQPGLERLFDRICFTLPPADPPLVMQALPANLREHARFRVVRRSAALGLTGDPVLLEAAGADLDTRLGLRGDALLWIASYPVTPTTQPAAQPATAPGDHVLWVAQYPQPSAAREAEGRYKAALADSARSLDRNTILKPAHGLFLVGSWNARAEAAEPQLDGLLKTLPAEVTSHPSLTTDRAGG